MPRKAPAAGTQSQDAPGDHLWLVDPRATSQVTREEWDAALARAREDLVPKSKPPGKKGLPEFITVMGAPGAGKSTVAMAYVRRHGRFPAETCAHLDFDAAVTYHPRFRDIWSLPDAHGRRRSAGATSTWTEYISAVTGLMDRIAGDLVDAGHNVVMHSVLPSQFARAWTEKYRTVLLYVGAPSSLCVERAKSRALSTGKFLGPSLEFQRRGIIGAWSRLQDEVPLKALWADVLAVVNNCRPGVTPAEAAKDAVLVSPLVLALFGPGGEKLPKGRRRSRIRELVALSQDARKPAGPGWKKAAKRFADAAPEA